jgi:dTDP-L-rhamnose 4-epimerase
LEDSGICRAYQIPESFQETIGSTAYGSSTHYRSRNPDGRGNAIAARSRSVAAMILVTGGAGFIGSHIVDALVADGAEVRVLDLLAPGVHRGAPEYLNDDAEFVHGDVADASVVAASLRGATAVCHQASMVGLGRDFSEVDAYVRHNDVGTAVLLRAMAESGFAGRLVLASSMVVYGEGRYECPRHGVVAAPPRSAADLRAGLFDPRCPVCFAQLDPVAVPESAPLDPRNVYAATKVHQEHLCFAFARETDIPVAALRYHNVYGPRMPRDTPYAGVAALFVSALAGARSPRVFEDGRQLRDFVQVRDVARANVLALTAAEPVSGAFNIASGQPRTVAEMAAALADAAGPDAPRPVTTGEFRLGDVRHVFASAERARSQLGFTAREGFEAGMREFALSPTRPT